MVHTCFGWRSADVVVASISLSSSSKLSDDSDDIDFVPCTAYHNDTIPNKGKRR